MPKGQGQTIVTTVTDSASRGFDDKWKLTQDINFSKFDSQFFWEHGLTHKITLVATTAYQDVDFVSRTGEKSVHGFGTSSLGARYQVYGTGRTTAALQASYMLAGSGEVIADADLGSGGNGIELRALAGRSHTLMGKNAFTDIQAALIYRGRNSPSTFKTDGTFGLSIDAKRQVLAQAFYSKTNARLLGNDRVLPNEFIKLQGSIVFKRSESRSTQFGVFQTVAGRNIVQEKGVFVAVWRRY